MSNIKLVILRTISPHLIILIFNCEVFNTRMAHLQKPLSLLSVERTSTTFFFICYASSSILVIFISNSKLFPLLAWLDTFLKDHFVAAILSLLLSNHWWVALAFNSPAHNSSILISSDSHSFKLCCTIRICMILSSPFLCIPFSQYDHSVICNHLSNFERTINFVHCFICNDYSATEDKRSKT